MKRHEPRPIATFAALLGVLLHALVLVSAGLASDPAAAKDGQADGSLFWSICVNGRIAALEEANGQDADPGKPAPGMPACPLCAPASGLVLIPPGAPVSLPALSRAGRVDAAAWNRPYFAARALSPPARGPPRQALKPEHT